MQNQVSDSEIQTAHANWLRHPVTQAALRAIQLHEEKFIKSLVRDATDVTVTDEQLRMNAVGLKTCNAIKVILSNHSEIAFKQQELVSL